MGICAVFRYKEARYGTRRKCRAAVHGSWFSSTYRISFRSLSTVKTARQLSTAMIVTTWILAGALHLQGEPRESKSWPIILSPHSWWITVLLSLRSYLDRMRPNFGVNFVLFPPLHFLTCLDGALGHRFHDDAHPRRRIGVQIVVYVAHPLNPLSAS